MKRIFVADDSAVKLEDVCSRLKELFPDVPIDVCYYGKQLVRLVCRDYRKVILEEPCEYLVVTDMQMPWMEDSYPEANCGCKVLNHMQAYDIKCPAIVVSSEHVSTQQLDRYYDDHAGSILYKSFTDQTYLYKDALEQYYSKRGVEVPW